MADAFPPHAKTVLVTGATTGIGDAIARVLAQAGHRVWGTGRKVDTLAPTPGTPGTVQLDVTDPESVQSAIDTVIAAGHGLDAVVNNAGIGMMGAMGDTTEEELLTVYRTNVVGLHTVSRMAIPHLISSKGHLLHVGSVAGVVGLPFRGVYCSSKAAVELIAEAQSMELARHGVRVHRPPPGRFPDRHQQQPPEGRPTRCGCVSRIQPRLRGRQRRGGPCSGARRHGPGRAQAAGTIPTAPVRHGCPSPSETRHPAEAPAPRPRVRTAHRRPVPPLIRESAAHAPPLTA